MTRSPLLLVLLAAAATGCAPCARSCSAEGAVLEHCLQQWELEWADLGAVDEEDFTERCTSDVQVYLKSLDDDSAGIERRRCSELDAALSGETDCDAAWQALLSYGAEP